MVLICDIQVLDRFAELPAQLLESLFQLRHLRVDLRDLVERFERLEPFVLSLADEGQAR